MNCGSLKGWQSHRAANTRCCDFCAPYDPRLANPKKQIPVVRVKPGPKPKTKRPTVKRPESPTADHGTNAAHARHKSRGEKPCDPCREAQNAYARSKYKPRPRKEIMCGTAPGRAKHRRTSTPVCDPCRLAYNEKARERHAARMAA